MVLIFLFMNKHVKRRLDISTTRIQFLCGLNNATSYPILPVFMSGLSGKTLAAFACDHLSDKFRLKFFKKIWTFYVYISFDKLNCSLYKGQSSPLEKYFCQSHSVRVIDAFLWEFEQLAVETKLDHVNIGRFYCISISEDMTFLRYDLVIEL